MTEPPARSSTTRRDLASAYLATAARVGSWAVVAAVVMRRFGTDEFALLALVRGTLSILNYGTLGLGPAMIHHLARGRRVAGEALFAPAIAVTPIEGDDAAIVPTPATELAYVNPVELRDPMADVLGPLRATYAAGLKIALYAGLLSVVLLAAYAWRFDRIHTVRFSLQGRELHVFVLLMGLGAICRLVSEAPGAVLQVQERITRDNVYQFLAEATWVAGVIASFVLLRSLSPGMWYIGAWFAISGALLLVLRLASAATLTQQPLLELPSSPPGLARTLLGDGGVIVLGQLANYLYAPAAMILINRMLDAELVAYYEAAVQVDAALLLLVSSVATVLLPKAAVAHAADDRDAVKRYYVRGTLGTFALLALAAIAAIVAAPYLYPLWLGQEMRTTRAILPILLISTVVGGSGMVGRSILIGMGKAGVFTVSALIAGVANVVLAIVMVRLGYGLRGIVMATAIVVIARAGLWLPWYVLRTLEGNPNPQTRNPNK
jgi:O-antigen/teichoic acid export membrane protein